MPLGNFATILPFLSPSPRIPYLPHVPTPSEEKPTLRICFPLKIQRGASSWWEYEEFRIQFRDRLMWRQAFALDGITRDPQDFTSFCSSSSSSSSCSSSPFEGGDGEDEVDRVRLLAGANRTFYNDVDSDADDEDDEERGMKSHWSFSSSSSLSTVYTEKPDVRASFVSEAKSAASSNRFMYLIPRLRFLTRVNDSTTKASSSSPSVRSSALEQNAALDMEPKRKVPVEGAGDQSAAPFRPPPPPPPLFGTPSSAAGVAAPAAEAAEILHHRHVTLQKLEGSYLYKTKERYLSTFRSLFRTSKPPAPKTALPVLPPLPVVAPLRMHSPPRDPGTFRISPLAWAHLWDAIVSGLSGDAESWFPFPTEDQKATFMRVEQKEGRFKVEHGSSGEGNEVDGCVKEALERMEKRNWEDVLFVAYEDTPRTMRWWYTTREPQVFDWGADMI
ncbi:hypothetical protein J3F83DRAFT_767828 [Trichoderma novae-zelandiae]